jgi:hypothetical protein
MKIRDARGNILNIGDEVERIEGEYRNMCKGDRGIITSFREDGIHVDIKEFPRGGHGVKHLARVREENEI